jgi:hypothetical protein
MDLSPQQNTPPSYQPPIPPSPKKGMGIGAMIGIGCGAIIVLLILAVVIFGVMFGGKIKEFTNEASKDPTRATATMMVTVSAGEIKMIAEDEVNKRYTLQDKQGKLTTIYWDEAKGGPNVIEGDFSAIPVAPVPPVLSAPEQP